MQRRSFAKRLFSGLAVWLFGTRALQVASPPYVTVLTGKATLFVDRAHSVGEYAGRTVTESLIGDIPVKQIQYGDGKTVVKWAITEEIYRALDPQLRAFDPQSGVPTVSLIITSREV